MKLGLDSGKFGDDCNTFINHYSLNVKYMVKLNRINLSNEGLTKFLSPIESTIMNVLWEQSDLMTVDISEKTDIPISSVAGTLDRLVKSGYAHRQIEKSGGRVRYKYTATFSHEEMASEITTRVLDSLVDTFGSMAIENFAKYKK
ncbi:MAG: BlaI/MecI/CopY family transcriptional regulator [Methanosarcinales archaeon]|nr:BlaI/MecI/CopY family transcriptional regulator [Methanosarcinales archaeon]